MPAIKKETTKKKAATKSTAKKPKKTTAKTAKKKITSKKTVTKKTTSTKKTTRKTPAKNKIAVRKVEPIEPIEPIEEKQEEPIEAKEEMEVKEEAVIEEPKEEGKKKVNSEEFEQFLEDFSEDQAQQEADEKIEHHSMLPANKAIANMAKDAEDMEIDDNFGDELEEKTHHEIGYQRSVAPVEDDPLAYDNLGRSVGLYRKIAYFFVALVVVLLVFIFFFSVVKTTIVLIPDQERIQNNIIFDVYDKDNGGAGEAAIKGLVRKLELSKTKTYEATGTRVIGQEAVGTVTIYNNYSKNQPLVATTRLLSTNNELFRIKNTVNVPAGGSVDVEIYADDPSPKMAIEPTRFTIPGLWAGLQDKIYAESKKATVYQKKTKKRITQEDIDNGIRDLKQILLDEAKLKLSATYGDYTEIIYNIDENSVVTKVDGDVDEEKDEFDITVNANVVAIAFDGDQAVELARQKFNTSVSDNKELLSFNENIDYTLNNFDAQEGVATINASFEGKVSLKENSKIIDKNKIVGLKESQLKVYLDTLPGIAGYKIKFYPSFIKKVPKLVDRIIIKIEK